MQLTPTVFSTEAQPHTFPLSEVARKRCAHCGETKPIGEFYNNRAKPDGLSTNCKVCQKEFQASYGEKLKRQAAAKRCSHCGKTKPRAQFYANRSRRDGLSSQCKRCLDEMIERSKNRSTNRSIKPVTPQQEKTVRMKQDTHSMTADASRTSVSVTGTIMSRIRALRDRLGFAALQDVVAFALDTAESNTKAIEIAKARADLEAAEQRLRILSMDAAPIAKELTKIPVAAQKTNGTHAMVIEPTERPKGRRARPAGQGVPSGEKVAPDGTRLCSRRGCTRTVRGKYKQCLHHRREGREYMRRLAKKRARAAAANTAAATTPTPSETGFLG